MEFPRIRPLPPKAILCWGHIPKGYLLIVGNNATPETALVISMMGAHLTLQRETQSEGEKPTSAQTKGIKILGSLYS